MIYDLLHWIEANDIHFRAIGLFQYISVRFIVAFIAALLIATVIGKKIINILKKYQIKDENRELGLAHQEQKKSTPTMGGIIIIISILIPTLLFCSLFNIYILLMIVSTLWLAGIGFIDDYIKVFCKKKEGLAGKFKLLGQIMLGVVVGTVLYFHPQVKTMREVYEPPKQSIQTSKTEPIVLNKSLDNKDKKNRLIEVDKNTVITTIPFIKTHELNYKQLLPVALQGYTFWLYLFVVIFVIVAVSNGSNLTDGLDGLVAGISAIIGIGLGIFSYVSSNITFAEYLNVMFIPNLGEISIFIGAFIGACIGFLWFNAFPAQVFMGDTGSLALGGIIAVLSFIVHKELLIPIFCGVFLVENLSVMMQVFYFKYTKRKYVEGRRLFLMSPLHHHFQKLGYHENKIVIRFWLVTIFLVALSIITLKIR
ncbi:MAG: phospho-N-acetylmuramoyl-pentapeptide-transferase [Chitinophagaceae bacterium]